LSHRRTLAQVVAVFRKALDVVDDVLNQSAKLAADFNQVNVIDGSNCCVRIDRRDFDATNIVLLHNHVAEQHRTNVSIGLERLAR